ncbi:MAG: IS256 family transposase [Pseudohongiellaceae bacterium]
MTTQKQKRQKRRTKKSALSDKAQALLDELLEEAGGDHEAVMGEDGLMDEIRKRLIEAMLSGEMTSHLGYEAHDPAGNGTGNSRNGYGAKTVHTKDGPLEIDTPRDRNGSFEPQAVRKGQRRIDRLDDNIISLYARGLSTRDIAAEMREFYGVEVSATLISDVTGSVAEELEAWQSRPLDAVYPVVYFDCLHVNSREDGTVRNRAVYLALGVNMAGEKELLGLWLAETEGARFWLRVFGELKSRGLKDIFIACMDGLNGLPEAIESVYRDVQVQLCIVHQVRSSLRHVRQKRRREVAADLRDIYNAPSEAAGREALARFAEKWGGKYPAIAPGWERNWARLAPFFAFPPAIRKAVYTTNAIESLNSSLRKVIKGRGAFPNDDAVRKVLYLALRNASKKWTRPIPNWKDALNQFMVAFGDRVPV